MVNVQNLDCTPCNTEAVVEMVVGRGRAVDMTTTEDGVIIVSFSSFFCLIRVKLWNFSIGG